MTLECQKPRNDVKELLSHLFFSEPNIWKNNFKERSWNLLWGDTVGSVHFPLSESLISLTPPSVSLSSISSVCVALRTYGFCSGDWGGWMAINSVCGSSSRSVNFNLLHHHSSHLPLCLFYSVSPACFTGPEKSDPISSRGYDAMSGWHHAEEVTIVTGGLCWRFPRRC